MGEELEAKNITMVPRGNGNFDEQFDDMATNFKLNAVMSPAAQALSGFLGKKRDAIIDKARELYPELEHPEQLTPEKIHDVTMNLGAEVTKMLERAGGSEADIRKMNGLMDQFTNMMKGVKK